MEEFDVGLALEGNQNSGYAFTVSNKLFSYLLAGLVVVATDTKGQQEIMSSLGDVGVVYPDGSKRDLVAVLQKILKDRTWLAAAKQKSWDIARSRFCWDLEQRKFLQQIESLPVSTRSTAAA
jgi:glycosyltransferase involved in cell wall biosynthesis